MRTDTGECEAIKQIERSFDNDGVKDDTNTASQAVEDAHARP